MTCFKELREAVKKIGVGDFSKETEIKEFETKGLDTDLSDLFPTTNKELFTVLKDGSIRKTIIHIVEITHWRELKKPIEDLKKEPPFKFHIFWCQKIKDMTNKGKKDRYRKSGSRSPGFLIKEKEEFPAKLQLCKFCLKEYNHLFNSKKTIKNFSIKEYMEKPFVHDKFKKMKDDICTVPNIYSKTWSKISKHMKEQKNWQCQSCFGDFSGKECRKFLHTHHINADKTDNKLENLKVLCIKCHSKEPKHSFIKDFEEYKEFKKSNCYYKNKGMV